MVEVGPTINGLGWVRAWFMIKHMQDREFYDGPFMNEEILNIESKIKVMVANALMVGIIICPEINP